MSRDELAVGAESQKAALPKQNWTVFQQLASCLCPLGWLWLCFTANAALLSPYVWLQSRTLAVSKRLDLFRYASTAYAMWKRGKQEHPANMSTQQLSTQPSWDRLWCLCERRKVSVQADTTAARYGKKVQRYQSVGGRQTQGLRTKIGGEPQLYLGSNTKPGRKSKEGGEGGSERRDEMKLMGESPADAG